MADQATITLNKDEQTLIDSLEKLNVVSLNNVVKFMEQKYGISAAPAAVAVAAPAGGGAAAEEASEKSAYDIEITEAGGQKIAVIRPCAKSRASVSPKRSRKSTPHHR